MQTQESVIESLKNVKYPGYSRDIVSFGLLRQVTVDGPTVRLSLLMSSTSKEAAKQIEADVKKTAAALPGVSEVQVEIKFQSVGPSASQNPWENQKSVSGIRHVVAVASGKGGVGKSTVSVNLACALQRLGARIGLLDCDIYGPSIPLMMGIQDRPTLNENQKIVPLEKHGVKLMSIGFLVDPNAPLIWRGRMIQKSIQQFLMEVAWGDLDFLLIDLPPGTGDAQLTLCQTVPLSGGVVVTTPQEASLNVVRKGMGMFEKVNVPILGIVENMSYFSTPTGERIEIFGHGGGRAEAERKKVPFLGEVPIYTEIRIGGDKGEPVTASTPDAPCDQVFLDIARALQKQLP
jgi:ATP-binding protein involved in chromosome partitioning